MRLTDATVGTTVIVRGVADGAVGQRLVSIGFVPGTSVEVRRRAPLGDPVVYRVRGADFAIRRSTAEVVEVEHA